MKKKNLFLLILLLALGMLLAACGGGGSEQTSGEETEEPKTEETETETGSEEATEDPEELFTVAMVTDVGGVDDKSFNQSAWEGLQAWGAEHGREKGDEGYDYLQSESDSDYVPNLNQLSRRGFDLIYGIGFMLAPAIEEIAAQQPDTYFGIVDSVVEAPNVASLMFKEQEVSFLAGVAAAMTTETGKVGFVGGMESDVIQRFETGFRAGVFAVDPDMEVIVNYTGAFDKADLGKQAANAIYSEGADVIFHAAGATGNGVFAEAKERKQQNPDVNVWVIGVDSDQYDEGTVEVGGQTYNVTLTSALKRVDVAVHDVANRAMEGDFPGGETLTYGLADNGVELATTGDHMSDEVLAKVNEFREQMVNGDLVAPGTYEELDAFMDK